MAEDVFPSNDDEFNKFFNQFVAAIAAEPDKFGVPPQDVTTLQTTLAKWNGAYTGHVKAQDAAVTATGIKDAVRAESEGVTRPVAAKVHATAGADNSLRLKAALQPRDLVRTPIGAPTTRPIARAEGNGHLTLALYIADEHTPKRSAKPKGAHACEIFYFVGDSAPADESGYSLLKQVTKTPYIDVHPADHAGKTVYYIFRWLNAKLEHGPWSDVVSAKVPL